MTELKHIIIGCGDVGRRIATQLVAAGESAQTILGLVQTQESVNACHTFGINVAQFDLDKDQIEIEQLNQKDCYYLVPPQKSDEYDARSRSLLAQLSEAAIKPARIVLISTTGVYGDCDGQWVTEQSIAEPQTERGKRRLDSEQQWQFFAKQHSIPLIILRVPGIYANSRIPKKRIEQNIPVVRAQECGYTNRIHADDLSAVAIVAMQSDVDFDIYNVTDGTPGKISEYLQAAAAILGLPALPEISMQQAKEELSTGMLSYLSESRRISNEKMLKELKVKLRYPNFKEGLKFG